MAGHGDTLSLTPRCRAVSLWREGRGEAVLHTHVIRRQEEWPFRSALGEISQDGCTTNPARRAMRLLRFLAQGVRKVVWVTGISLFLGWFFGGAVARTELPTTEQSEANAALVAVRDSGPGIDPAHLERVFEAFYTTKINGVGMGSLSADPSSTPMVAGCGQR